MRKKYPRAYAQSTLKRMREGLEMKAADIELLESYFTAMSNFYEILPLSDAYRVIELLSDGLVTKQKFLDFAEMQRHTPSLDYRILGRECFFAGAQESEEMEREIIHVSVLDVDEYFYHELKGRQYGIPLYIPTKNQLLKYVDEDYFERSVYTEALKSYLIDLLFMSDDEAEERLLDAYMHIRVCDEPESAFAAWSDFAVCRELSESDANAADGRIIITERQLNELASLFFDMYDNTRLSCYRGFTLNERHYRNTDGDIDKAGDNIYGYDYLPTEERTGQIMGFPYSGSFSPFSGKYVDSRVTKNKK